jgi:hypothetical protein
LSGYLSGTIPSELSGTLHAIELADCDPDTQEVSMKWQVMVLSLLMTMVSQTAPAPGADVTIVSAFPGNKGPGWKETIDVAGAVGPKHVVDFDEGGFVVHDKATGKELQRYSPREFWHQVEPPGSIDPQKDANDPRILYDPLSERWFACAAGTTVAESFLAVSTSSDPTQHWKGVKLPLPKIDPYMKMGVDRNGLYICSSNGDPDWRQAMNCYAIPRSDVIAPGGPVLTHGQTFTGLRFAAMPAMDLDPDKTADAPELLLVNEFSDGTCSKLYMYRITWSGLTASISDVQTIPLSKTYQTPTPNNAVQPAPGPMLRAGGGNRRLESVFVHNGSVFGCNGAKLTPGSRPGILWYELRISDGALLQEGLVDDPKCDYLHPSLAVDSKGNIGVGCTRTSETEFPSVYVMMHAATDPASTMRAPVLAVPGTTCYRYSGLAAVNLSHYSSTCIDPSNPNRLWTYQAYANSTVDKRWCTAWAAFSFSSSTTRPASGGVSHKNKSF